MDLAAIRAKVKVLIGDSGYLDAALDVIINRHYQKHLPLEFALDALKTTYTTTTSGGIGEVAIDPDAYVKMTGPAYLDGERVSFWTDGPKFWDTYPRERAHNITGATIGTSTFTIAGKYASKFIAPHTFIIAGSTGNNGMWTVASVSYTANVTSIVVVETISDATADGTIQFQINNSPEAVLYEEQTLFWRPFADTQYGANYEIKVKAVGVPTALVNPTDKPIEQLWGPVLAVSTAMEIFYDYNRKKEGDALIEIRAFYTNLIGEKEVKQFTNTRAKGSF